jgi:hypothetical protein
MSVLTDLTAVALDALTGGGLQLEAVFKRIRPAAEAP